MVKAVGPAMSLDVSGSLGGVIEYRTSKGIHYVSKKHKPGSRAPFVLGYNNYQARLHIANAVDHWHLLSTAQKKLWKDYIK